jgi:alginate O-acetyltransferase complex protein AlgI
MAFSDPRYFLFLFAIALALPLIPRGIFRLGVIAAASFGFYIAFSAMYAAILLFVTLLAYAGARVIYGLPLGRFRAIVFATALLGLFSPLAFFKYMPTILASLPLQTSGAGFDVIANIVLPVGISFYTFQAVGYLIDVYVGVIRPETGIIRFAAFTSFFPQLTAGPIARSAQLLPQMDSVGHYDYGKVVTGLRLLLVGMFMKVVIADNLAPLVDTIYATPRNFTKGDLLLATLYFSFQVYADFAGYSLLAIGSAKLLGIDLMTNFKQPYLSQTLPEYWRTWHISLSSWFRDYLLTPLQLQWRNFKQPGMVAALVATFIVVGVWHGAGAKYALFGLLHGVLVAGSTLSLKRRNMILKTLAVPKWLIVACRTFLTFWIVTLSFVLFRANAIPDALFIYKTLVLGDFGASTLPLKLPLFFIGLLFIGDVLVKRGWSWDSLPPILRYTAYQVIGLAIMVMVAYRWTDSSNNLQHFIYFKF